MDKQKGLWIALVVVVVLVGGYFVVTKKTSQPSEELTQNEATPTAQQEQSKSAGTIKIGSILPLTGDGAAYGEPDREIMQSD